jgi:alpha-tubulin suppressor-like RCC1 family protein
MTSNRDLLFNLLAKDRSLYTYQLPEEIVQLVLNYTIGTGYLFRREEPYVPEKLNINVQDISKSFSITLLLTPDGQCYIKGNNDKNAFGINAEEEYYISNKYPNICYYRNDDENFDDDDFNEEYDEWFEKPLIITEFINISELKKPQLGDAYIVKIDTGFEHAMILTSDHKCYSFGSNSNDQLGIGRDKESNQWNLIAENVFDIDCGSNYSCYLSLDNKLYIFGSLLRHDHVLGRTDIPTLVPWDSKITKIFATNFTMGFVSDNNLYVFGSNSKYKTGIQDSEIIYHPTIILDEFDSPIRDVMKLCCGHFHMCVLTDKYLYVCGSNRIGQLGLRDIEFVDRPRIHEQFIGQDVTDIATGPEYSFVIANKICYGTGLNSYGGLSMGHREHITEFTPLPLFTPEFVKSIDTVRLLKNGIGLLVI